MINQLIGKIRKYLGIELSFMKFSLMTMMQYRAHFFIRFVYELVETATTLAYFFVVLSKVKDIGGWGVGQLAFITVYAYLIDSLCTLLFIDSMILIPSLIENGKLDLFLIKPINKQFILSFSQPCITQIFNVAIGIISLILTAIFYHFNFTVINVAGFILSTIFSLIIMYCVLSIVINLSFWLIRIGSMWTIVFTFHMAGTRPGEIYSKGLKFFMTFIVPSLVVLNFPVRVLYSGEVFLLFQWTLPLALVFIVLNILVSNLGLKRYTSAGG